MLAITVLGVLLVPAFYVAVERLAERRRPPLDGEASPREGSEHGAWRVHTRDDDGRQIHSTQPKKITVDPASKARLSARS